MPTLWFVVPVHGRENLTKICLEQLRRTCDALIVDGVEATAVVVGNDRNIGTAKRLGFATVRRNNQFVSRKFNDGIQLALDRRHNPRPADFVVPCGSDDWVDHRLFLSLPGGNTIKAFRRAAFVNETGTELAVRDLSNPAGVGIRVYPRSMMKRLDFRPADEDRSRACDTSILTNVLKSYDVGGPRILYGDQHDLQIVDWKTRGQQLNRYDAITARHRGTIIGDPFDALEEIYPAEALEAMCRHYEREAVSV